MDKINFIKGDILDTELLEGITKDADGVFHQAALASVQDSFDEPDEYHNVNVNGTENILKLSKKYNFEEEFNKLNKKLNLLNKGKMISSLYLFYTTLLALRLLSYQILVLPMQHTTE